MDDNTDELATWIAGINADFAAEPGTRFRCRFVIQETGGNKAKDYYMCLYYRLNGGSWVLVSNTTSNTVHASASSWITDEESTTQQIGSGTYAGGWSTDDYYSGENLDIDVGANEEIEIEFSLNTYAPNVEQGDEIELQVWTYESGSGPWTACATYTNTPTITIQKNVSYQHVSITGGGTPSDDTPAYMEGRAISETPAMLWGGYDVGGNTRQAIHANIPDVIWPRLHAYCYGAADIRFDVVSFGASGSAITQDITGDLNGYDGKVAFFMGHGAETNDTVTADMRAFFGFTDGTGQYVFATYIEDTYAGSSYNTSGGPGSGRCAGMYYSSGGYAHFDSWITDGVRIDWNVGSDKIYDCAALIMGEPDDSDYIESHVGTWSNDDSEADDTVEVTGVGFKPDLVVMLNSLNIGSGGGAGFTVGAATRTDNDGISQGVISQAFGSGYFNYPGTRNNQTGIMAQGISGTVERWKITDWTDDGFNLECVAGNAANDDDGYYIALKLGYPSTVKMNLTSTPSSTGDWSLTTGNKPSAVMTFQGYGWGAWYPNNVSPFGMGFFDASTQVSGSARIGYGGNAWIGKSVTHDSKALLVYGNAGTKRVEGTISSFFGGGYKLNFTTAGSTAFMSLAFGTSYDHKDSQSVYMYAHSRFQAAQTHGKDTGKSSVSAFLHVIDAYDSTDAYLEGDPDPTVRSDTNAYTKGTDTVVIAVVNTVTATSTGTQDITTTELNGLTPKAAIITAYGTKINLPQDGMWKLCSGYTDGIYTVCVALGGANDGWTPYSMTQSKHRGSATSTNIVLLQSPGSTAMLGKAEFDSWITNGIRIDWTYMATIAHQISVTFFAGSDLDVDIGMMTLTGGTTTSTTGPGWKPDLILFPGQIHEDETLSTVITGWYHRDELGWAVRDAESHSAYRHYSMGDGYYGYQAEMWCYWVYPIYNWWFSGTPSSDPGHPDTNSCFFVYSWDTNGFTMEKIGTTQTIAYFALRFGGTTQKRAAISGNITIRESHSGTLDYDIVPVDGPNDYSLETIDYIYFQGAQSRYYIPWSYDGQSGMESNNIYGSGMQSHITAANMSTVSLANWGYFYDCYNQYFDQKCNMYFTDEFPIRYYYVNHDGYDEMEDPYRDTNYHLGWCLSKVRLLRGGIRMKWENSDWSDTALNTSHCIALAVGTPVWHDGTPAYMKGVIHDWPSRTPRGCYLEGQTLGISDDQDAFLKGQDNVTSDNNAYTFGQEFVKSSQWAFMDTDAVDSSDQDVYIEGYEANKSVTPAHLHGQEAADTQQPAYMDAKDTADSSTEAYLFSLSTESSDTEAFLDGNDTADSSTAAYLTGPVNSSTLAWTRGSWDAEPDSTTALTWGQEHEVSSSDAYLYGRVLVSDDTVAYLSGIDIEADSTHAYLSAHVNSAVPAYLGGQIVLVDYAVLTNSDRSLSKKFVVLYEGYSHGQLMKGSQVDRTVGGGTDLQASAIYRVWEPTIKVMETENEVGYGDLADLETFYSYNDPDGTPSDVLTFRNHYQEEFQVITMGELFKSVVTQKVEGTNAIYYVRLALMEKK